MEVFMQNILDTSLFYRFRDEKRSRYDIEYLQSMHKTIFAYARGHPKKLQKAFLIVLNLSGILVDEEKLEQINFDPSSIRSFKGFMKKFKEI